MRITWTEVLFFGCGGAAAAFTLLTLAGFLALGWLAELRSQYTWNGEMDFDEDDLPRS